MKRFAKPVTMLCGAMFSYGCVAPLAPKIADPTPRYYGVAIQADRSALSAPIDKRSDVLSATAKSALKSPRRVAFLPPDQCVNTSASPTSAETKENFIGMDCGVLMAKLETSVAQAGYEVISWQVLRQGISGANPIPEAKRLNVEVIFEVNQLSIDEKRSGLIRATGLEFFSQESEIKRESVGVQGSTAQRCKGLVDKHVKTLADQEDLATLAVKAVDVESGRALWYYQNTLADLPPEHAKNVGEYYFDVPYTKPVLPSAGGYNGLQLFGAIVAGVGGVAAYGLGLGYLLGSSPDDAESLEERIDAEDERDALGAGFIAALSVVFVGMGVMLVGNRQMSVYNASLPVLPLDYSPADDVLCAGKTVIPVFTPQAEVAAPTQDGTARKSTYTFVDQQQGSEDQRKVIRERLFQKISLDFTTELKRVGDTP